MLKHQNASSTVTTVEELMALRDADFVRAAYCSLLGREPDATGFEGYLEQVRIGVDRSRLIAVLAASAEAQQVARPLPGLDAVISRHTQRHPGLMARVLRRLGRHLFADLAQELRAIDNNVHALMAHQGPSQANSAPPTSAYGCTEAIGGVDVATELTALADTGLESLGASAMLARMGSALSSHSRVH